MLSSLRKLRGFELCARNMGPRPIGAFLWSHTRCRYKRNSRLFQPDHQMLYIKTQDCQIYALYITSPCFPLKSYLFSCNDGHWSLQMKRVCAVVFRDRKKGWCKETIFPELILEGRETQQSGQGMTITKGVGVGGESLQPALAKKGELERTLPRPVNFPPNHPGGLRRTGFLKCSDKSALQSNRIKFETVTGEVWLACSCIPES